MLLALIILLSPVICYFLAKKSDRNAVVAAIIGFIFPLFSAVLYLILLMAANAQNSSYSGSSYSASSYSSGSSYSSVSYDDDDDDDDDDDFEYNGFKPIL